MLTLPELFHAAQIAVFAVVVSTVLVQPGNIFAHYGNWLETLPDWLGKPLGLCAKCFAGQCGFWWWTCHHFAEPEKMFSTPLFTASAILSSMILIKWASS
jgi:hypothetical protein